MSKPVLSLSIDSDAPVPAYRQLYLEIRKQIENGAVEPGTRLTPIRTLADGLGIARNTVETAYKQLKTEGYIKSKRGSGYVVEDLDFSVIAAGKDEPATMNAACEDRNPLGDTFGCAFDFSYGNRSVDGFPVASWRSHANTVLSDACARGINSYTDPFGNPRLREQLAAWLAETRGCHCTPEQIVIQPGTQPALRNISLLLGGGKCRVAFEDPGYDGARLAFESMGCNIVPVSVYDGHDAFLERIGKSRAKLAFVTPASQFPLGRTMPIGMRLRFIDWAVRHDAYIIEDDYCCEYRYDGAQPLPSLQSLDTHERVIYMGTVSKVLSPALRITYLILPPALVSRWNEVFPRDFCSVPWLEQEVLARYMATEQWRQYVRRTVNLYHNRHDLLIDCLNKEFGDKLDVVGEQTGLHVLAGLDDGRSAAELIELARKESVRVYGTDGYWAVREHPMRDYVLIGFSSIPNGLIEGGISALRRAWIG